MPISRQLPAVASALIALALPALAADPHLPAEGDVFMPFGHSGGWYVFTDTTRATCLTEKVDATGNVVQIGLTKDNEHAYLAVYAVVPEDLRKEREELTVTVAGESHTGKISRWQRHNADAYSGGYILSDSFDLFAKAADVTEVIAFPGEEIEVKISLDGSANAIEMTKDCIAAQ